MTPASHYPFRPEHYPVVAVGIDTLHYTAPIELKETVVERLQQMQDAARDLHAESIRLGADRGKGPAAEGLLFVMLPRSVKRYRWGLQAEEWGITIWFTDSRKTPGVKVEIGSRALWHFGQEEAYRLTKRAVAELCEVGTAFDTRPARCDFTVDFQGVPFVHDMQIAMVSRARKRPEFEQMRGLCANCDAPFLDDRATLCCVCGTPRHKFVEAWRELPEHLVHPSIAEPTKKPKMVRFRALVSGERSPNPHLMPRGAQLEYGALPMQRYGGTGRRPFTGWTFGDGKPLMVRLYNKCIEVSSKSPDKVWFYNVWNRSDGYVHCYCPDCGREHAKAEVLAADDPLLPDELPISRPKLTKKQKGIRLGLGLDEEDAPRSGLPRLAARVCTFCSTEMRVIPVWRLEVQARGDLLTKIAPDGTNRISSVEEVIRNTNELWSILVGQANRHCKSCHSIPEGKGQRWRICRKCLGDKEAELGRKLNANDSDDRELMAEFKMVRRAGWIEARDASKNPDGKTAKMPVTCWWRCLQAIHFEFSAPATMTSAKLKNVVSADINRTMARGCITSWAHASGLTEKITQQLGRTPTAEEWKDGLWREMFGKEDPLELYASSAFKDVLAGKPFVPLARGAPRSPRDSTYCLACGEVGVPLDSNGYCKPCQMPPPPAKRRPSDGKPGFN